MSETIPAQLPSLTIRSGDHENSKVMKGNVSIATKQKLGQGHKHRSLGKWPEYRKERGVKAGHIASRVRRVNGDDPFHGDVFARLFNVSSSPWPVSFETKIEKILKKEIGRGFLSQTSNVFHKLLAVRYPGSAPEYGAFTAKFHRYRCRQEAQYIIKCLLSPKLVDDEELCRILQQQDNGMNTPLMLAATTAAQDNCNDFVALHAILKRISTLLNNPKSSSNIVTGIKNALQQFNSQKHNCLTLILHAFTVAEGPTVTGRLLNCAWIVLDLCAKIEPDILLQAATLHDLTPLHLLLKYLPLQVALGHEEELCLIAQQMIDTCPSILQQEAVVYFGGSSLSRDGMPSDFPRLSPFMHLKQLTQLDETMVQEKPWAQQSSVSGLLDRMVYTCMEEGYSLDILYTPGKELTTSLDLSGYANCSLTYRDLDVFRGNGLQNTLEFVRIPSGLSILDPSYNHRACSNINHTNTMTLHLETVSQIFKWLDENCSKTTRILRLEVAGPGEACECLENLMQDIVPRYRVEIWNWGVYNFPMGIIRKATEIKFVELSSCVIAATGQSSIREIRLYFRGNIKHLQCWTSGEITQQFPKLQSISVVLCAGSDGDLEVNDKVFDMIEKIKTTLETREYPIELTWSHQQPQWLPQVNVNLPQTSDLPQMKGETMMSQGTDGHYFLKIMHQWARYIARSAQLKKQAKKIRVAILDDGFDLTKPYFRHRCAGAISFHPSNLNDLSTLSYMHSDRRGSMSSVSVGYPTHGNQMAYAILELCSDVEFIFIRLHNTGGSGNFTPRSASQAIKWASSLHPPIHIMSMSWTIEFGQANERNIESYDLLHSAVRTAISKDIILLCATTDKGFNGHSGNVYPGAFDCHQRGGTDNNPYTSTGYEQILTIGAAGIEGTRVYGGSKVDFIFPGLDVLLPVELGGLVSGSSISTAIATGVAANLLFLREVVQPNRGTQQDDYFTLPSQNGATANLATAFRIMSGNKNSVPDPVSIAPKLFELSQPEYPYWNIPNAKVKVMLEHFLIRLGLIKEPDEYS